MDLNESNNENTNLELRFSKNESKLSIINKYINNFDSREKSIITDLFYSRLLTTYRCECNHEQICVENISDYPLLIPQNIQYIKLMDLLKSYFNSEFIEFETECENCKKAHLKHLKKITIYNAPKIMILSIQRINPFINNKNNCFVKFSEIIDIGEFLDIEKKRKSNFKYSLFAVINHTGSLEFGHYYSYIKINNIWYEFNDNTVQKIGKKISDCPNCYSLFYVQI